MRRDFEVVVMVVLPVSDGMVAEVGTLLGMVVLLLNRGSAGSSTEVVSRVGRKECL
jgi:hypothetical protein